ncbi:MAG: NADH-quinone oxidoreductase subunit C [Candidatus Omnitrophota bacterium]|nr:NADH-quinone oxidoreductase subunit C [Candidatus Omnitrophota bacterium]
MIKEEVKEKLGKKIKEWVVKNPKRIYVTIDKNDLKEVARILYRQMQMRLSTVTGIDNETNFELIYHFSADKTGEIFNLRIFLENRKNPEIDSLCDLFKASNWVERELYEMLGINFNGHPHLKRLLLAEDWPKDKFPLRKNYNKDSKNE